MNISQLRTFVAVVEHGSFSAAARSLGLSQPAVTLQIQSLEANMGATLLERRYRKVDLTESGRALLPHARRVLSEVSQAEAAIGTLSTTVSGHLRIAASTTPGDYVVPRMLGSFVSRYPDVTVSLSVHDSAQVVETVAGGLADVGVTGAAEPSTKVTFDECGSDEIVVICPPGHPLAGRTDVPYAKLVEFDWIARESGSGTGEVTRRALRRFGVDPDELDVVVELGTGEAVLSAVQGGLGIAMVSSRVAAAAIELGTVVRVRMAQPPVVRPFFVVLPKGTPTRAASAFADALCATFLAAEEPA